jgi:acylphosphatase
MAHNQRLHALIKGHVQGVGFRYFVRESAAAFPVTGWVRNRHDGNVELVAEGDRADLEKLLGIVKEGPRGSLVTSVRVTWEETTGEFDKFGILATA